MSETHVSVNSIPNTPHVDPVVAGALNASDVQKGIDSIVQIGKVVAALSHNQSISKVVDTFSALASQSWFVSLIVNASSLFDKGDKGQAVALIASSCPEFNHGNEPVVAEALNPAEVKTGIEAILQVATIVGTVTGNAAVIKAVSVISNVARQEWFVSVVVNLSSFFTK